MNRWVFIVFVLWSTSCFAAFSGNTNPSFLSVLPNDVPFSINNAAQFGDTSTLTYGTPAAGSTQSGFGLTGRSFNVETGVTFAVADLVYNNGTIELDSGANSTRISLLFDFAGMSPSDIAFEFDFLINETPNTTGDPFQDRDFVQPVNIFAEQSFSQDGVQLTLALAGFSNDGGATLQDEFVLEEDGETTSQLFATIRPVRGEADPQPAPVPEPASFIVWGALVGLVMLMSKAKKYHRHSR